MRKEPYGAVLRRLRASRGRTMLAQMGKDDPWQTLIATILSARSRDETTDVVARSLFQRYPECRNLATARVTDVERVVKKTGFYHTKARRIIEVSRILMECHGGRVPEKLQELLALPGIGPKTAACVLVYAYGKAAVPVDTHVHRICNRLGWVKTRTPEQTEQELRSRVPRRYWLLINDLFVYHGKNTCKPIRPLCSTCPIEAYCAKQLKER